MRKKLYDKYKNYNLPIEVLDKIYDSIEEKENTIEFSMKFEIALDNYIASKIKEGSYGINSIVSKYNYLKVIANKNPKYKLPNEKMNDVYIRAIRLIKYRYSSIETMSHNILDNIKYVINTDKNGYDIKFLKEYLSYYKEDRELILRELGITEEKLNDYLNGIEKVDIDVIEMICIIYDVDNYEELNKKLTTITRNKKVEIMSKKANDIKEKNSSNNTDKKYRITFLKKYLEVSRIPKDEMAKCLDVNMYLFDRILDGSYIINSKQLDILCEFFNVKTFDELKEKIIKETQDKINKEEISKKVQINNEDKKEEVKKEIKVKDIRKKELEEKAKKLRIQKELLKQKESTKKDIEKLDMSFMKEYVERFNYSKKKLSELWHCGSGVVDKILNGQVKIKEELLWETYTEFKVKNYEDLKEEIKKRLNNLDNTIKNRIKEEERIKAQSANEKIINIDEEDKDKLFNLLNVKNMNYRDSLITILLFGGITDKSIDEISDFLQISKVYIIDVYRRDLEAIKKIYKGNNDVIKLIYRDKEVD